MIDEKGNKVLARSFMTWLTHPGGLCRFQIRPADIVRFTSCPWAYPYPVTTTPHHQPWMNEWTIAEWITKCLRLHYLHVELVEACPGSWVQHTCVDHIHVNRMSCKLEMWVVDPFYVCLQQQRRKFSQLFNCSCLLIVSHGRSERNKMFEPTRHRK